jgi:hypothetical protein
VRIRKEKKMNVKNQIVSLGPIRKTCLALAYRLGQAIVALDRTPRRLRVKRAVREVRVDGLLFLVRLLAKDDRRAQ